MSILVTGADGFIGCHLVDLLKLSETQVVPIVRGGKSINFHSLSIGDITSSSDLSHVMRDVEVVVHLAGCAHKKYSKAEFREGDLLVTANLAHHAAKLGVRQFIYISTVLACGCTKVGDDIGMRSRVGPVGYGAYTKKQAELALIDACSVSQMKYTIVRSPLVYGPGVKANFLSLMRLANTGVPLPFAGIHNSRSMVCLGNLVDFIVTCIDHPLAANQTFLISDGRDLSLSELLRLLRSAMGRPFRLFSIPNALFRFLGIITGKGAAVDRLLGSLQVDSTKARDLLGWQPPYSVEQGLRATVDHFLKAGK